MLGAAEVRLDVAPGPARAAGGGPVVVVAPQAADVDEPVDAAAAAEHATAAPVQRATAEARVRLGLVAPVGARLAHQSNRHARNVGDEVACGLARLEQHDLQRWPGIGQPAREHTTRAATADNDDVCFAPRRGEYRTRPWPSLTAFEPLADSIVRYFRSSFRILERTASLTRSSTCRRRPRLLRPPPSVVCSDPARAGAGRDQQRVRGRDDLRRRRLADARVRRDRHRLDRLVIPAGRGHRGGSRLATRRHLRTAPRF